MIIAVKILALFLSVTVLLLGWAVVVIASLTRCKRCRRWCADKEQCDYNLRHQ